MYIIIIEKVFKYEETELSIIKYKDEIWFKAVAVATILRYKNTMKSIRNHFDPEDKRKLTVRIGAQIQTERNGSSKIHAERIVLVENGIGIQGVQNRPSKKK